MDQNMKKLGRTYPPASQNKEIEADDVPVRSFVWTPWTLLISIRRFFACGWYPPVLGLIHYSSLVQVPNFKTVLNISFTVEAT